MENNKDKLFVGGDISGIQSFIYNITSKKAALSLKGRSAWLDEYLEGVCKKILGVSPQAKEIYCGGGKFYLIVPNEESVKERIIAIHKDEEAFLWNEHFGQLAINIAIVPYQDEFGLNFKLANEEFAKQKNSKFKSIIIEDYDKFFEVQKVGGSPEVCAVTGIEANELDALPDDSSIKVLRSVKEQIVNGQIIRKEQHLKDTFEDYAKDSYLGILRMDVDDLGAAFQSCKTFDEYHDFSEKLKWYFGNYLKNELWNTAINNNTPETFHDWTDIIYAGGDDVFIVGKWNIVIQFAELIRNEFVKEFPERTLSAGIAIVGAKFPISKAAQLAGEAEESAKKYGNGTEKNAFCFLRQTVSWNGEFEKVKGLKSKFFTLCKDNGMPRSILHRLMVLNDLCQRGETKYLWHTAYFLKRFTEGKSDEIKELCNELKTKLTSPRQYQLTALAARWAELELRELNNK